MKSHVTWLQSQRPRKRAIECTRISGCAESAEGAKEEGDGGKSTIAGWGDKLRRGGPSTALRAFKPGVKPGFISDLFTPGKQLTHGPAIPGLISSVYSKQSRRDSFYLTNDPGIANHSRKKQFIPVKWTHSMSFWFKARRTSIVPWSHLSTSWAVDNLIVMLENVARPKCKFTSQITNH